jgi:hypothetical protein
LRETCATDRQTSKQASRPARGRTGSSHQVYEVANLRRLLYVANRESRLSLPALPVNRGFFRPKSTFLFRHDILFALEILLGQDMLLCLESPPCPCLISPLIRLRLRSYPLERLTLLAPLPRAIPGCSAGLSICETLASTSLPSSF